jgi:hypothetical protein
MVTGVSTDVPLLSPPAGFGYLDVQFWLLQPVAASKAAHLQDSTAALADLQRACASAAAAAAGHNKVARAGKVASLTTIFASGAASQSPFFSGAVTR